MIPKNRVKEVREARNISGLELSRMTKIAPSTIHNIENAKTIVYPGWKKRIAKALNTPLKKLFPTEKEVTNNATPKPK